MIKSNTFNIQDITQIQIKFNNGRLNNINFVKKEKEYISFFINQKDINSIVRIISTKGNVSVNIPLIKDSVYNFKLFKSYQIPIKNEENIIFQFDVPKATTTQNLKEIFSRIYINNELKILGEDEFCTYGYNGYVQCKFVMSITNTKLEITYNEFTQTIQEYYYIIYSYDVDTCLVDNTISDNDKFYIKFKENNNFTLLLYNQNYNITRNLLKEYYSFYFQKSQLKYGINIIQIKLDQNTIINLEEVGYYPQFNPILITSKYITSVAEFKNTEQITKNVSEVNSYIYKNEEKIPVSVNIEGSKFIANFENIEKGVYIYFFGDKCEKQLFNVTIRIYNNEEQRLEHINPNYINKNDLNDSFIYLNYSNNFTQSNRPLYIQLVHKSNHSSIKNATFYDFHVRFNIIRLIISSQVKSIIPKGNYLIKTVFQNAINETVSIGEISIDERLALYENKHIIETNDFSTINQIAVIFTSSIYDKIDKVIEGNKNLSHSVSDKYDNILLINITIVQSNNEVNKELKIFEKNREESLNYTLVLIKKNNNLDIIVSHYVYKISEDGYAYITISGNVNNIDIEDSKNMENITLNNYFVQRVNKIKNYTYKYSYDKLKKTYLKNTTIHVVNISSFINENINECQINYCDFDENENCFRDFIFEKKLELPNEAEIIYSITSINSNQSIELNLIIENDKLIPDYTLNSNYSNDKYKLIIKRKDKIDQEPFILFNDRNFIFTNLTLLSFEFIGEYVIAKFNTLCIDESKLSVNNATFIECSPESLNSNNIECKFELEKKVEFIYYLSYGNIEIANVSTELGFTYEVSAEMAENGKAKFSIKTLNHLFGPQNVVYFTICDNITNDRNITLYEYDINYDDKYAYVEIPEYNLSRSIYFCEFGLHNGLNYTLNVTDENDNMTITFEHVYSVNPDILFSYQDNNELKFKVNSSLNNVYLNTKVNDHYIEGCKPGKTCNPPSMEYGIDYMINSYHDIILHTYKFSFELQCINKQFKNIKNTNLNIYGEKILEKIKKSTFTLNNNLIKPIELKFNGTNKLNINLTNLNGSYYLSIDKTNYKDYNLTVITNMNILNTFGNLYSLVDAHEQYLIVNFDSILKDNYDVNIMVLKNEQFNINLYCEHLFNNETGLICKSTDILNKGEYFIGYIDKCGNEIMSNKTININNSSNPLPNSDLIKHVKDKELKNITFNKNISNDIISKIELLKTKIGKRNEDLSFSFNANLVNITINNIDAGNYIIVIHYNDGTKIIVPQVIVYDKKFKIINGKKINTSPFNIKNTKIQFEGEFHSNLVQKVQLFTPFGYKEINYILPKDGTKNGFITITEDEKIEFGEYRIELSGDVDTYYYFIYCIFIEKGTQNIKNGLTLNKNNIFFDYTIKKGNDMSYFREIVKSVKSKEMEFKIHYCEVQYCRIGVYKYNEKDFKTVKNIVVSFTDIYDKSLGLNINLKVYPKKFILDNIPFENGKEYVTLHTDLLPSNQYITLLPDKQNYNDIQYLTDLKIYRTVFPYHSNESFIYDSDFYYLYEFNQVNAEHSLIFTHPSKIDFISFSLKFFECNKPGYFYNIKDTEVTCDACADIYPDKPNKSHKKNECVKNCPSGGYLYNNQCYTNCTQANTNRTLLHDSGFCVFECMENHGKLNVDSDICIDCGTKGLFEEYGMCVKCKKDNCPIYYNPIDEEVNSCDNYKCQNNGECYIKNNNAYCKCPENRYGHKCELTYKEGYRKLRSKISEFLKCESYYFYPVEERGRNYYDENNNIIYDLDDQRNINLIKEISALAKEPRLLNKVTPKKRYKLFHVISTLIIRMKEGLVKSSPTVLELLDLGMNMCSSTVEIKRLVRLRLLDENEEEDPDDKDQFDDDTEYPEINGLESLSNLIEDARETYKVLTINEMERGTYGFDSISSDYSKSRKLYYQRWSPSKDSYSKLQNQISGNDEMIFIDFSSCINESSIFFTSVTLPSNLNQLITDSNSSSSYTDAYDTGKGIYSMDYFDLSDCHSIMAYLPVNNSYVDLEKYKKYQNIGVDIFKNEANIYYDTCYVTNDFNYDLTQKYRRTQIFENKTFTSPDCSYLNIDLEMKKVKMQCDYVENFTYYYKVSPLKLNISDLNKVENLPLKCFSSIGNITRNIGFFIYLLLTVLILGSLIFNILNLANLCMKKEKITERIESENDNIKNLDDELQKSKMKELGIQKIGEKVNIDNAKDVAINREGDIENNIVNNEIEEEKKTEEEEEEEEEEENPNENNNNNGRPHVFDTIFEEERIVEVKKEEEEIVEIGIKKEQENEEPFCSILGNNFMHYHPILRFSRITYFKPILTNICLFAFNCTLIFGTNATFYSENLIEKRIYDENRNKFIYPLKNEIMKMIYSLITTMIGMLFARLIMIISRKKIRQIREFNEKSYIIDQKEFRKIFELKGYLIRRLISNILMLLVTCFFFIYCIVFCAVYKNTQFNWFIGGIICLLFELLILSPIYIVIISIVEKKGGMRKTSSFYMKKLFLF